MKKSVAIALLLFALTVPALAGDTGMPPCKQDCGGAASTGSVVPAFVVALVLALITK